MVRRHALLGVGVLAFVAWSSMTAVAVRADSLAGAAAGREGEPTFTKDVAPIFYKHCVECHRPTMFAPMSLVTFEDARPWARAIRSRVAARSMPPWNADPAYGVFKNDPRLSDKEVATILAWVDAGAPKGNDADLPAAPTFVDGWSIGQPDAVFAMTEPFTIAASGEIPYQYMRIPARLAEDKWIQAIEIKPSARKHVHHVIAYTQPADQPLQTSGALGPGNIGGVTPNKPGVVFPEGIARLLRANTDIVLQMHYTTNGEEAVDRTEVGIVFAKQPPRLQQAGGMVLDARFVIPPGAANHEVRARRELPADITLTSLTPHMHVRGKDMTYTAYYPDGRSEVLLRVPNYDFNWQHTYQLAEPKVLPKGTAIEVVAHYDNSPNNKFNPDPAKEVRWGDQTWEEMMIGFYGAVVARPREQ
jgi:mono/diheme cytochrome c family protein